MVPFLSHPLVVPGCDSKFSKSKQSQKEPLGRVEFGLSFFDLFLRRLVCVFPRLIFPYTKKTVADEMCQAHRRLTPALPAPPAKEAAWLYWPVKGLAN